MYQSIFSLQNGTKFMTNSDLGINFVDLVFQSKQDVISYYNQSIFKTLADINLTYIIDNNYVYFTGIYYHGNVIYQTKYNWHTGWLSTYNSSSYSGTGPYSDKNVVTRIYFSKTEDLFSKILQNIPLLVGVAIILLVTLSVVIIGFKFKKYLKLTKDATFKNYLREKAHKNKNIHPIINVDKSLEIIDEILNESQKPEK